MATWILLNITLGIAAFMLVAVVLPVIAMRRPQGRQLPAPAAADAPRREPARARELAGVGA